MMILNREDNNIRICFEQDELENISNGNESAICYLVWGLAGEEFCLSNYDMGIMVYNYFTDMVAIISYNDVYNDMCDGGCMTLYFRPPTEDDRECIKEELEKYKEYMEVVQMKKNVEKIERTITEEKVTYIACDGRVFDDEENCSVWERDYRCVLNKTYKEMPKVANEVICNCIEYVGYDNYVQIVRPQTEEDITTLNAIYKLIRGNGAEDYLTFNDMNEIIAIDFGYDGCDENVFYSDWVVYHKLSEYIKKITENYDKVIAEFESKEVE